MNAAAKHTDGPWRVSTKPTAVDGIEHAGGFVAFVASPRSVSDERLSGESWLDMRDRTRAERDEVAQEKAANARLIAAAPDLLERSQIALGYLERMLPASADVVCAISHLRAAIAAATRSQQ